LNVLVDTVANRDVLRNARDKRGPAGGRGGGPLIAGAMSPVF
jgi:hypothetical protein